MSQLSEIKDQLPGAIYEKVNAMNAQNREAFICEFNRRSKKAGIAYLWWFIASGCGCHYLYLRKWLFFILFLCTFGGFLIWWVIDAFRIPRMVKEYNKAIALAVFRDIQVLI